MCEESKPNCCCRSSSTLSWFERLSSLPAIIISGVAVLCSLLSYYGELPMGELAFALIALLISGIPIAYSAWSALYKEKRISAALLITTGMLAALYIGEYFAAAEVAFIMALGEYLEERALARSKSEIQALLQLVPTHARLIDPQTHQERTVEAHELRVGDEIRILPGESIAVDGCIESGASSVNQAILTGESLPLDKNAGDEVLCGTTNLHGVLQVRCTRRSEDSSLNKMVRLIHEAGKNKSPIQRQADKWASILVPVALVIAVLTYFFTGQLINAVTVLVVFCPCALVLATPVSIMAAIGQASKNGVLIKNGAALEALGGLNAIAFDKTGTLTEGQLVVSDTLQLSTMPQEQLDAWILRAESLSEHPLAKAIVRHYRELYGEAGLAQPSLHELDFSMLPGQGVRLREQGHELLCGSLALMQQAGMVLDVELTARSMQWRAEGKALVFVALDGRLVALIALSDRLRDGARQVIDDLGQMGMSVSMLTGDHHVSAQYMARSIGIEEVYSELLPEQKLQKIQELQQQGHKVAMVGDGVNDAAALKLADVGIAMGKAGSDIAIDSADIALFGEDLTKIRYLKKLAQAALGSIKFNIALSLMLNIMAVVLAVGGLIGPAVGALLHNVGSVLVILNAARLLRKKIV